jgi:signal transduction histidine kinase
LTPRTASRVAWSLFGLSVILSAGSILLAILNGGGIDPFAATFIAGIPFPLIGALIAARFPRNAIGWLFIAVGLLQAVENATYEYARYGLITEPGSLPLAGFASWVSFWAWMPSLGLLTTFTFLLFPSGRLPSPRWRWAGWLAGIGIGLVVLGAGATAALLDPRLIVTETPFEWPPVWPIVALLGGGLTLVGAVVCVTSLIFRFRRSHGEERQQLKWVTFAGAFVLVSIAIQFTPLSETAVGEFLIIPGILSVPVAAGIAILRHRLYDVDVVINKTVVYGILAVFVTVVYVAIAIGIGALVGSRGNLLLSIAATGLIAVAFQPVRDRARRFANHLVYGKRASPYEVLSEFSDRVATSYAADDVLQMMARLVGEGTGAAEADVWLAGNRRLTAAATWPSEGFSRRSLPLADDELPELVDVDRAYPVRHQGELLGALAVRKPRGEPLTPAEGKLLSDLASQAGLVLRNVRLIEDLRASRQRLVTAQDEERRRLERNIHDGAQQQLVALTVKMRLVQAVASKDPAKAAELAEQAKGELQDALDDLRDLARGIYPPLLADQGLPAALEAQARKAAVPVEVHPDGVGRYPQEVEAGAYFCVLEALQNVAKYAEASRVDVRLRTDNGSLVFEVTDDGKGFDPQRTPPGSGLTNMRDRLEALGGSVEISSRPGEGTTVSGRIPVQAVAESQASESRSGSNSDLGI